MPYVSAAQRRFFHTAAAREAGITADTVERWDDETRGKRLPERASDEVRDGKGKKWRKVKR